MITSTLAAIAHVGMGMAFASLAPAPHWMSARVAKGQEVDLETEVETARSASAESHAEGITQAHGRAPTRGPSHADEGANANANGGTHAGGEEQAGGDPNWTFDPIRPGVRDLGVAKAWAYTSPLLAPPKEDDAGAHKMIIGAMDAHDRELGLAADGPLVSATQTVARASRIPEDSTGRIVATFDENGAVVSVDSDGSGDAEAWRDLRDELLASMKQKKLRVPQGAKGLRIVLKVVARLRTGAAHDKGQHVEQQGIGVSVPWEPTDMLIDKTTVPVRVIDVTTRSIERL